MTQFSTEQLAATIDDLFMFAQLVCMTIWLTSGLSWLAMAMCALLLTGMPLPGLREVLLTGVAWTTLAFALAFTLGRMAHH